MNSYDEYQDSLRYKNGYYAFRLIIVLGLISSILGPWAETPTLELFIIIMIAICFDSIRNTYQGAYFSKMDKPILANIALGLSGLLYLFVFFYLNENVLDSLFVDGKVSYQAYYLILMFLHFSIPITYFIRLWVEKKKDE